MKQALYWSSAKKNSVKCNLCPRKCLIPESKRGDCRTRENRKGKLYSLVYGKAGTAATDPVEKKPLFHFLPETSVFSIGTAGCNLHCRFCQNWELSQSPPERIAPYDMSPENVVSEALRSRCRSIAYTYNEPAVFYEYALDTAKLAKKKSLKSIIVSNGFINKEPLEKLCRFIDAANIDLKAFDDNFYRKHSLAWIEPVLESIKILKSKGIWLELTNMVIPGLNDSRKKIKELCTWVLENLGPDVPVHFSAFYPNYIMQDIMPTPPEKVLNARKTAIKSGINYAYAGNINDSEASNTYCPECGELLVERKGFSAVSNRIIKGLCSCGQKIPGLWDS